MGASSTDTFGNVIYFTLESQSSQEEYPDVNGPLVYLSAEYTINLASIGPAVHESSASFPDVYSVGPAINCSAEYSINLASIGPGVSYIGETFSNNISGPAVNVSAEYSINLASIGPSISNAAEFNINDVIGPIVFDSGVMTSLIDIINRWGFRSDQGKLRGIQPSHKVISSGI